MRRIFITPEIEEIASQYAEEMKAGINLTAKPKENLKSLKKSLQRKGTLFRFSEKKTNPTTGGKKRYFSGDELPQYSRYVEEIINLYDELNSLHPRDFIALIERMESTYTDVDLSVAIRRGRKGKFLTFANHIVKEMDYEGVRDNVIRKYISSPLIGIKTCIYCNAQYAITTLLEPTITEETIKNIKGRGRRPSPKPAKLGATYDLDHNYPKDKYPYLCTNFYNLQPCCPSCNRHKSDNPIRFSGYCWDTENPAPLHFELESEDIIMFQQKNKCDGMQPKLKSGDSDATLVDVFNKAFSIDAIYSHHTDEVQELLWRHKIYSQSGIEAVKATYKDLFPDDFDAERFIYGTYVSEKDAHKRPLSIMKQDIIRQIKEEESKGASIK